MMEEDIRVVEEDIRVVDEDIRVVETGDWLIITTVQGQLAEDWPCVPTFLSFVRNQQTDLIKPSLHPRLTTTETV